MNVKQALTPSGEFSVNYHFAVSPGLPVAPGNINPLGGGHTFFKSAKGLVPAEYELTYAPF